MTNKEKKAAVKESLAGRTLYIQEYRVSFPETNKSIKEKTYYSSKKKRRGAKNK